MSGQSRPQGTASAVTAASGYPVLMTQPHVGQVEAADLLTHHDSGYPPAVLARQGNPAPTVMHFVLSVCEYI